jgi:hypothetical protein
VCSGQLTVVDEELGEEFAGFLFRPVAEGFEGDEEGGSARQFGEHAKLLGAGLS